MKSQMPETERKSAQLTKDWVKKHQKELVKTADEVLKKEGVSYRAQAKVTSCYFPDKRYGDIIFPEGEYEALRITLGSGKDITGGACCTRACALPMRPVRWLMKTEKKN